MCLNLIINLPYCEKWVRLELLFFSRQRSLVWSGALPCGGCVAVALGVAEACLGVGPTSPVLRQCPFCYFHQVLGSNLATGNPFLGPPHSSSGPDWSFLPRMPVSADPRYHSFPQLIFVILPGFSEQTRANMGVRTGLVGLTLLECYPSHRTYLAQDTA